MFIRTERLFLRPAWPEDLRESAALLSENGAGVMSNITPIDKGDCDCDGDADDAALPELLITLPSTAGSALIGGIRLTRDAGELRLGYWLSRSYWGSGFAAEAARGMLALARVLGYARVFAGQSLDDRASLLVLTRAGFRPTGEQRAERGGMAAVYVADLGSGRLDGNDLHQVRAA